MSQLSFDEAAKELKGWTQSLLAVIDSSTTEARNVLTGDDPHPTGAPSREAMAGLVLGEIGKKLNEVNGMYRELRASLSDPQFGGDR